MAKTRRGARPVEHQIATLEGKVGKAGIVAAHKLAIEGPDVVRLAFKYIRQDKLGSKERARVAALARVDPKKAEQLKQLLLEAKHLS